MMISYIKGKRKLAYTEFKTKRTLRLHKAMIQDYGKITVIYGIK